MKQLKEKLLSGAVWAEARKAFKNFLQRLGVGGFASTVATKFTFRYVFKPIADHLLEHKVIDSYQYTRDNFRHIVHQKGVIRAVRKK